MGVVRVDKDVLLSLLEKAVSVVPSRDFTSATKNFYFVTNTTLSVTATDNSLWISTFTDQFTATEQVTVVIPAQKLLEITKEAPDGELHIHIQGQQADIFADRCSWTLALADPAQFPVFPDLQSAQTHAVPRKIFTDAIILTRHAAGRDAVRQHCMMIDVRSSRMTATDGSGRLQQTVLSDWPQELEFQIPISAADTLLKVLSGSMREEINIVETDNYLAFESELLFIARKSVHTFPDVETLTISPALLRANATLICDLKALEKAIRRVRVTSSQETSGLILELQECSLSVRARDDRGNSAVETIDCRWTGDEGRMVCVNHKYLSDLLRSITSWAVVMKLGPDSAKSLSPLILQDLDNKVLGLAFQMRV